ncbi:MAG: response regulator transcription factor [Pseudobutyrivibrio sp.]|nr:response regulator transcription factor [Pseudobutyrivibrio sp.]
MLQIAICDDDTAFSSQIEDIIEAECDEKNIRSDIEVFTDGYYLLKAIKQGSIFNIIFLDIEMKKLDGLATAREIRKIDSTVLIIYISGFDDYLKELFEVEPFRFISKPLDKDRLIRYFGEAYKRVQDNEEYFQFSFNKELKKCPLKDIVYFESNNRTIYIHLNDGSTTYFYGKLADVEEKLKGSKFVFLRPHQSYYVNYHYIKKLNFYYLTLGYLNKDIDIKISVDRQKAIKAAVLELAANKMTV